MCSDPGGAHGIRSPISSMRSAGRVDYSRKTMKKRMSKAEREAHDARIDARIARLREMAEKGEAELARKRAAEAERPQ